MGMVNREIKVDKNTTLDIYSKSLGLYKLEYVMETAATGIDSMITNVLKSKVALIKKLNIK